MANLTIKLAQQQPQPPRLRGIILRADGEELVVQATTAEVARYATTNHVIVERAMGMSYDAAQAIIQGEASPVGVLPGQLLYDGLGRQVAIVEEVHIRRSTGESHGPPHNLCDIRARGL